MSFIPEVANPTCLFLAHEQVAQSCDRSTSRRGGLEEGQLLASGWPVLDNERVAQLAKSTERWLCSGTIETFRGFVCGI